MIRRLVPLVAVVGSAMALLPEPAAPQAVPPVVVASRPFAESFILAEMFAQLLEARGISVARRPGLGSTEITFEALRAGEIDVYPEYTGTGLLAILGEGTGQSNEDAYRRVAAAFRERWGIRWLPPLGFENTYAIAVRRGTADSLRLTTLSDLERAGADLTAGFSPTSSGDRTGCRAAPGLRSAYGLFPGEVRALLQAVKYRALAEGGVDVIDGYATDGQIIGLDLVVLADDRGSFPPYDAAALASRRLSEQRPDAVAALVELSGRLDEPAMRALNRRVEVDGEDVRAVVSDDLTRLGLLAAPAGAEAERPGRGPLLSFLWARRVTTLAEVRRHMLLVLLPLVSGALVAIPFGLALERSRKAAEPVIRAVGLLQMIPRIALLAFMIPLLGIGMAPAVVSLFLYSLFPIVRNTYTGVRDADPSAVGSARALGMTELQLLTHVRLPLVDAVLALAERAASPRGLS